MSKIKKKYKGTRYVSKVLGKYFKKRYPSYRDRIQKAREITDQLRSTNQKFTVKNVSSLVRVKRQAGKKSQKKAPELFYKLTTPAYYFDLVDYPTYINDTTKEITFVSSLFNDPDYEIEGGQRQSYSKLFSSYVNYINSIIDIESDDYSKEYLVVCTPPEFNNAKKRWESEIISVDQNGSKQDYGFQPDGSQGPIISQPQSIKRKEQIAQKIKQKKQEKIEKSSAVIEKELDVKILKEKSRQQANEMFLKGLLTKSEYKNEIKRIDSL